MVLPSTGAWGAVRSGPSPEARLLRRVSKMLRPWATTPTAISLTPWEPLSTVRLEPEMPPAAASTNAGSMSTSLLAAMSAWFSPERAAARALMASASAVGGGALGEGVALGAGLDGVGLGLGGYSLGVGFGVGQRSAAGGLGFGVEQGGVAVRLGHGPLLERFALGGVLDGVAGRLGQGALLVGLGVGGPAHLGLEAFLGEGRFSLGQRGLLGDDVLRRLGLGQRSGLGRFGLGFLDLGFDLGPRDGRLAFELGLGPRRLLLFLGCFLVALGGRDPGRRGHCRGVGRGQVGDVAGRVLDLLDLEARRRRCPASPSRGGCRP